MGKHSKKYLDYLQSDKWKKKRKKIAKRAQYKCEVCHLYMPKSYSVHHKTYIRLGKEKNKDLMLLCHACHRSLHANKHSKPSKKRWIWIILFILFLIYLIL